MADFLLNTLFVVLIIWVASMVFLLLIPIVSIVFGVITCLIGLFIRPVKSTQKPIVTNDAAIKKGKSFEDELSEELIKAFPTALILKNLILRTKKFSKEIDIIALTTKGLLVIEAKNYAHCDIAGNIDERNWTVKYSNGNTYKMYNPIMQVQSGIWNVKKHIPELNLEKAVVFANTANLENNVHSMTDVYKMSEFKLAIKNMSELKDVYSEEQLKEIADKLRNLNTVTKEEHIRNVSVIKEMA